MKFILSFLLFLTTLQLNAQGEVKFYAETNARQVLIGRYFEVDFVLTNADGDNFTAPSFDNFDILSGPSQSVSSSSINGRWSRELRLSYTLQPKRVGKFKIGSGSISVKGKRMQSSKLDIEVLKGKSGATSQTDLQKKIEEQVFIRAVPSTSEAYVGQQITVDYKLYTTMNVETYNLMSESEYGGFFVQDASRYNYRSVNEVIDGIQYTTKIIKRVILFPQQGGLKTIDPFSVQLAINVEDGKTPRRRSFFNRPATTRVVISTDPLKINVRPFPPNAPSSFTGAVGKKYIQNVQTSSNSLSTDDVISITMRIVGDGDVKQVQEPKIEVDERLEAYEPRILSDKPNQDASGITYEKTVEYIFLPKEPGTYEIKPAFTYFNTDSLRYITLGSKPIVFKVRKGLKTQNEFNRPEETETALKEVRPLKSVVKLSKKGNGFFASTIYWFLLLMPLIIFGGAVLYRQKQIAAGNIDISLLKKQQAVAVAKKHLESAQQFLDNKDSRSFYNEVSRASLGYIGDKFNLSLSELNKSNIKGHLQKQKISTARVEPFMQILKTCEMALYGGMDNVAAMQETYQSATEVISGIEEEAV